MSVGDILQVLPAVVVLSVVICRVPMLRRDRGTQALWLTLAFVGVGVTFNSPPLYRWMNDATGVVTAGALGQLFGALGGSAGVRTTTKYLRAQTQRWPWWDWILSALTCVAVMVLLTVFAPARVSPILHGSSYFWDSTWRSVVYCVPLMASLSLALVRSFLMWWRFGRVAPAGSVRTGLTLVAVGACFGLLYVAVRATTLVAWELGAETRWWVEFNWYGEAATLLVAGSLLAWGTSWEAISAQLSRLRQWAAASAALRDLGPLWRALVALYPGIALRDGRQRRMGRFALLRRVVEIRDGLLALSDTADAAMLDAAYAAVTASEETATSTEAAVVAVLVHAVRLGPPARAGGGGAELPDGGGEDLAAEVAWLRQVTTAYRRPACRKLAEGVHAGLVAA